MAVTGTSSVPGTVNRVPARRKRAMSPSQIKKQRARTKALQRKIKAKGRKK